MSPVVEVFADITCPFTQVGLKRVAAEFEESDIQIQVRAWPLEWVNGAPLDAEAVAVKAKALSDSLGVDDFAHFDAKQWPTSTIPALNLAAAAYGRNLVTGLAVSMEIRAALFERGQNIGDEQILATLASSYDLPAPSLDADQAVLDDYAEGQRRGVKGSPHFWADTEDVFCPALEIGHDSAGHLTAEFDTAGLSDFIAKVKAADS